MNQKTPRNTIEKLIAARINKDFDTAFACYQPDATIVLEPGKTGSGTEAIKAFIEQASSLPLHFKRHEFIERNEIALHLSDYELNFGEKGIVNGKTADVLKRQADGNWLIIIDNAWAANEAGA